MTKLLYSSAEVFMRYLGSVKVWSMEVICEPIGKIGGDGAVLKSPAGVPLSTQSAISAI